MCFCQRDGKSSDILGWPDKRGRPDGGFKWKKLFQTDGVFGGEAAAAVTVALVDTPAA